MTPERAELLVEFGYWDAYLACPTCGAPERQPCTALVSGNVVRKGEPIQGIHPERERTTPPGVSGRVRNDDLIAHRLAVWKRLSNRGVLVADIAAELGMKRSALDQMLCRERRAGNPDAPRHPRAQYGVEAPTRQAMLQRLQRRQRREERAMQHSTKTDTKG
jgi:hypothetical protein